MRGSKVARCTAALCVACLLLSCDGAESPPVSSDPPWFDDLASSAGTAFVHRSGHRERYLFPEIMGGGAALADVDSDGLLDVYFVQGGDLLRGESEAGRNRLFRNLGQMRLEDITESSGADDAGYGMGVAAGDYAPVSPSGGVAERLVHTSRAAVFGDLDDDGGIDIETSARTIRRDVQPAFSYLAANDPRIHVGLGEGLEVLGVKVHWPDGMEEEFGPREKGRYSTLVRGES